MLHNVGLNPVLCIAVICMCDSDATHKKRTEEKDSVSITWEIKKVTIINLIILSLQMCLLWNGRETSNWQGLWTLEGCKARKRKLAKITNSVVRNKVEVDEKPEQSWLTTSLFRAWDYMKRRKMKWVKIGNIFNDTLAKCNCFIWLCVVVWPPHWFLFYYNTQTEKTNTWTTDT